jgi:hypothetical protein
VEDEARVAPKPRHDLGMLVGGVVVGDGVAHLPGGYPGLNGVEEADELLVAVAVSSTIAARQTCFCGLLRSATIAANRLRSAALT